MNAKSATHAPRGPTKPALASKASSAEQQHTRREEVRGELGRFDRYLDARRRGEQLAVRELNAFLRDLSELDLEHRRVLYSDLREAVLSGGGTAQAERKWTNPRVRDFAYLIAPQAPQTTREADASAAQLSSLLSARAKGKLGWEASETGVTASDVEQRVRDLRQLHKSYEQARARFNRKDASFSVELGLLVHVPGCGAQVTHGISVGKPDPKTNKRTPEAFVAAGGVLPGFEGRGVLGTKHRGFERGVHVPLVGSVTTNDPILGNKCTLEIPFVGALNANGNGGVGFRADPPIFALWPWLMPGPLAAAVAPLQRLPSRLVKHGVGLAVRPLVAVNVQHPALAPISEQVNLIIDKVQAHNPFQKNEQLRHLSESAKAPTLRTGGAPNTKRP